MSKSKKRTPHSKKGNRSIVGILLFGIVIASLLIIPVSAANLATPTLISPTNNQQFVNYPRVTTLVCKPVTGADRYEFVVEFLSGGTTWFPMSDVTRTVPYYTFNFVGDQRGRWRVIASDSSGGRTPSTPSAWRTFDYSGVWTKLATPVPLSPASNAIFYHFPRETTLAWKKVPGATGYNVQVEFGDAAGKTWVSYINADVPGVLASSYNFEFIGAQPGRWRVQARDSTVNFQDSDYSAWRKFTYKV